MSGVTLRAATMEDARIVFGWRNDPFIVERGSSQRTVTWEEHARWFSESVVGADRRIYIVEVEDEPAGQVRFDRLEPARCVVSAYLLERFTGRGLGVEAIRQGCERLFSEWPVKEIVACVRQDNAPGRAGFRKAGFVEAGGGASCPPQHFALVLTREVRAGAGASRP